MTHVVLTGAGGFTGSHVLRHILVNTDWRVTCPVTFRHRGNGDRIAPALVGNDAWHRRVTVDMVDLTAPVPSTVAARWGDVDYIMNVASESHVDRSLVDPVPFVRSNVDIMLNVLEYARVVKPRLVLQMSTDEVYGPAPAGTSSVEWDPILPSNPYSASKAAQEAIAVAYWRSYDVPLVITNTMNLFGQMQDTEKYLPKIIRCALRGETVPVHVGPDGEMGSRFYIHARNLASAWLHIIDHLDRNGLPTYAHGRPLPHTGAPSPDGPPVPARFNVVGEREVTNLELVELVGRELGRTVRWEPVDSHSSRPGHDLRYALNGSALAATGWAAPVPFEESLAATVRWVVEHPEWLLG